MRPEVALSHGPPESDWERRTTLPALDDARVAALVAPVLGSVQQWRFLGGGLANATVLARGPAGACVLRLYLREPAACAREAALLRLLADALPVPEVLHQGEDHLLLSLMPGRPLVQVLHDGSGDPAALGRSAGQLLARLHHQQLPDVGLMRLDDLGAAWSGYLDQLLAGPAAAHLGPRRVAALRALAPPADGPVVLCHGDYKPTNLLTDGHRITAVLDWEFAFAGDPCFDLGQLLRWADRVDPAFEQGVVGGYGPLPAGWRDRCLRLDLLNLVGFLDDAGDRPALQSDCLERVDRSLERISSARL